MPMIEAAYCTLSLVCSVTWHPLQAPPTDLGAKKKCPGPPPVLATREELKDTSHTGHFQSPEKSLATIRNPGKAPQDEESGRAARHRVGLSDPNLSRRLPLTKSSASNKGVISFGMDGSDSETITRRTSTFSPMAVERRLCRGREPCGARGLVSWTVCWTTGAASNAHSLPVLSSILPK